MPRTLVIVNPHSAGGATRRRWRKLEPRVLEVLRTGKARRIDAGHARYVGKNGQPTDSYFANAASFGVSSLVVELAQRSARRLGGRLAFAFATVRALLTHRSARVVLRVDGE